MMNLKILWIQLIIILIIFEQLPEGKRKAIEERNGKAKE